MGTVVAHISISIDGFFEGPDRDISWHRIDDEVHTHANEVLATAGAFAEGRVTYLMMEEFWPTADQDPACPEPMREFARIWRDMPKLVFSRTLETVSDGDRLVREVVPEEIRAAAAGGDLVVGGAELVEAFQQAGLIDEWRIYVHPVAIGRGRRFFPDRLIDLRLEDTRTFGNGVVLLRYATVRD